VLPSKYSGGQTEKNEMNRHVARMGGGVLVGKLEGKRTLVSCRRRWEDNIKMALQEVVWGHRRIWLRIETGDGHL